MRHIIALALPLPALPLHSTMLEPLWAKAAHASEGMSLDCTYLGSYKLNSADTFPDACESVTITKGGDSFDVKIDKSKCYMKRFGSCEDMRFTPKHGGMDSYSLLLSRFSQISRSIEGMTLDCGYLGSYSLNATDKFPAVCESVTITRGGDSFDAKTDNSKCYIKKCGSFANMKFTSNRGGQNSYSILVGNFTKITRAAEGMTLQCKYLGSYKVNYTDEVLASCSSFTIIRGGDSFDVKADGSKCYIKRCGSFFDMTFTSMHGGMNSYSLLLSPFTKITRAAEGFALDCTFLGSYTLNATDEFPTACQSVAITKGGDSFDAKIDGSKCYVKKCRSLAEMKFTSRYGGQQSFSLLVRGWVQLTRPLEDVRLACTSLGTHELSYTEHVHELVEVCKSVTIKMGGDSFDADMDGSKCHVKSCQSFVNIKFTSIDSGLASYSVLFPRGLDDWGPCDPADCLDLHLWYTSELRGRFMPVDTAGVACDPSESDKCFGGHARRLTYWKKEKAKMESTNNTIFMFDLGGVNFGGLYLDHPDYPLGGATAELMNAFPYDFCLFSSSDFLTPVQSKEGMQQLGQSYSNRTCPWLLANVKFHNSFAKMNDKLSTFKVMTTPSGTKVGFVGMFPHSPDYTYSFERSSVDLDPNSALQWLLKDEYDADLTQLNRTSFISELQSAGDTYTAMKSVDRRSVYHLGNLINVDVLDAATELKSKHPDVRAMVLLVGAYGGGPINDQVMWLLKHGPFDIILEASNLKRDPLLTANRHGQQRLLVSSSTAFGFGELHARVKSAGSRVERFAFTPDSTLRVDVASDASIFDAINRLYSITREKNAVPYGTITAPLTGTHRGRSTPPTANQCYYTGCPLSDIVPKAILWKARFSGHHVDIAFTNFGGYRNPLEGDRGSVEIDHCKKTLSFQNTIRLYQLLGRDLHEHFKQEVMDSMRGGFPGSGLRIALHEPCWDYVNHSLYYNPPEGSPPGTSDELRKCQEAGVKAQGMVLIDMEVQMYDFSQCEKAVSCNAYKWKKLEKSTMYTVAMHEYMARDWKNLKQTPISVGTEPQALCDYVAAHSPLYVEDWTAYRDRGSVQYASPEQGWAAGNHAPSVQTKISRIPAAHNCPNGFYLPPQGLACLPCPAGTRSTDSTDKDVCEICPLGFFSFGSGNSACIQCAAGTYSDTRRSSGCSRCAPGRFAEKGAMRCDSCPAGTFSSTGGAKCNLCGIGTYMNMTGATSCMLCSPVGLANSSMHEYPTTTIQGASDISACVCRSGTFADGMGCQACPKVGIHCPGGHSIVEFGELDHTPRVLPGFMVLPSAPMEVYICMDGNKFCPQERSVHDGAAMCPEGFDLVPACGRCNWGFQLTSNGCQECVQDSAGLILMKALLALASELLVLIYMYSRLSHQKQSSMVTLQSTITFAQFLLVLFQLQLEWRSPVLDVLLFLHRIFSVRSILANIYQLHSQCMFSTGFEFTLVLDCTSPLSVFVCFGMIGVVAFFLRRPLKRDEVLNVIGKIFCALYTSITSLSLGIFDYDVMPGTHGRHMVEAFPYVEVGSSQWWRAVPIAMGAVLVYCVGFAAVVTLAVWRAPKAVAHDSGFVVRFDFAFGDMRPDCWWWILPQLTFSLGMNLVHVFSGGTVVNIIFMFVFTIWMLVSLYYIRPFKYKANNWLEISFKVAVLMILIFSMAFVDWKLLDPSDADDLRQQFTWCCVGILVIAFSLAFAHCILLVWRMTFPAGTSLGQNIAILHDFRTLSFWLLMMSNQDFNFKAQQLEEGDIELIQQVTSAVRAVFLGQQAGRRLLQQRLLPGQPRAFYDRATDSHKTYSAVEQRDFFDKLQHNFNELNRLGFLFQVVTDQGVQPTDAMDRRLSWFRRVSATSEERQSLSIQKSSTILSRTPWRPKVHLSRDRFERKFRDCLLAQHYSEDKIGMILEGIFDLVDIDNSGSITMANFVSLVIAMKGHMSSLRSSNFVSSSGPENLEMQGQTNSLRSGFSFFSSFSEASTEQHMCKEATSNEAPQSSDQDRVLVFPMSL